MAEPAVTDSDSAASNSKIPPIFTYFGQFIDHDITANTDRNFNGSDGQPFSTVLGEELTPLPRGEVSSGVGNLRKGSLGLDSLYGEGPVETPFTAKFRRAMRDPTDLAMLRTGGVKPIGGNIPLPSDGKQDLPRLGDVLDDPLSGLSKADIDALPDATEEQKAFKAVFKENGAFNNWVAVIGDGRNDENLIVAQLHLAFLRFHNAIAVSLKASIPDAELRFSEAKKRTVWYYQWLVLNAFLPKVCDPAVVRAVMDAGAPLYKAFRKRVAPSGAELPLPLEFSVAAFRFGHTMVRAVYDHNRNFGRPKRPTGPGKPAGATFEELFLFTGGAKLGGAFTGPHNNLVSNWPIEWDRFVNDRPDHDDRFARKIDTALASPLDVMLKEGTNEAEAANKAILKRLADRNLRRGYRLNLPTAQEAIKAINASEQGRRCDLAPIEALTAKEISSGHTAAEIRDFTDRTPLWFYVLKEAEIKADGEHLGPLGSRLVAETLIGLVVEDETSYWNQTRPLGSWKPSDLPVGGTVIDSMSRMLIAAGVLQ